MMFSFALSGFNSGDVLFQLTVYLMVTGMGAGVILLIQHARKRSNRLERMEKKMDRILSKEKKE
ncbi:hypothetical protein [Metabacillus sp. 84]|uniref:hypothetical protein n=1 Tax=Metabacillus sp. 84 TaxID=3404705 RepID=UPI003CE70C07